MDRDKFRFVTRLLLVALAYFICGRLGLTIPYVGTHITLVWLPTGIAVAALMRWGYSCLPGIFLGALATNFSIDASLLLDGCIAAGNALAPLLAAMILRRYRFHVELDRAYDILLLIVATAIAMLVSAGGGVGSLVLFKALPVQEAGAAWFSWWAGDIVGVLLAAPLLFNISRVGLKILWVQRAEFIAWVAIMFAVDWSVFFLNNDAHGYSLPLVFLVLPVIVWSAMRFGMLGSSLGVLLPAGIAAAATSFELGPLHTEVIRQNLFLLWLYLTTLVLVNLMVAALQAGRRRADEALQQSEMRFREMFERHNSIMLLIDPDSGEIVDANTSASRFYGYPPERLLGMNIAQINTLPPDEIAAERMRAKQEHRNYFIFPHRLSSGEMRTVEVHSSPIESTGKMLLFSIIHDITERKIAEQATREAKERFEIIFNTSPNAILISRMSDGYITDANEVFTRLTGYTMEDMRGSTSLGIEFWVNPDDREKYVNELKTKGYCEFFETQFRRKDGSTFVSSVSAGVITIQGVQYIVGAARDITESRRIQLVNESLLHRYQILMKTALDGIRVMDIQGNIVEANDSFCAMLGYTQEEVRHLNISDWDAQWTKEELLQRLNDLIGKSARFETVQRCKDGALINVEISTTGVEIDGQHYFFASSRDITERKKIELELRDSERKLRMLMDNAADAVFVADPRTERWVYINERFKRMLGYFEEELLAVNIFDLVTPDFRDIYREQFRGIVDSGGVSTREMQLNRKDGIRVPLEMNAVTLPDGTVYGSCRDISERKKNQEAQRIAAVTFDTQEAIMITDADAIILRVNQAFQDITGFSKNEVIGSNPRILRSGRHDKAFYQAMWVALRDTGKWSGEIWDRRKDNSVYPKLMTITAVYDDRQQITNYVGVFRDISLRKKSEQEIHQLAFYDPLTGLPNRRLLIDRLQQALAVSARNGRYGALLFLDLDHFKTINDTQGHAMGDQLLVEVARRLQTCVREGDSVARLGGDEFVLLLEDLSAEADEAASQTEAVAEKIRMELDKPYLLDGFECLSTVSIGISLFFNHRESSEDLLMHADVAMYQAKMAGRNAIRFFDPQMQTALDTRASLEADLRYALEKRQFRLYYHIQVDKLNHPLGAEVLLRWAHPERGLVSPKEFIPLAEETGLIVHIGLWVLQAVCAQLKAWQKHASTRDLTLAVNVSARQFRQPDFVAQIQHVLQNSGAKPSYLKLELTESTVLENVEDTIAKMRELKLLGVGFSMDDFGTGYSSLQYLKRLPLDQIKIDQSFVRDITTNSNDAAIVQTIIAMTDALGLSVIAEGVESEAQREFLDLHGCHAFQGYLFGKPIPLDQFEAALRGESNLPRHSSALP
jgi:diguanylate cyclase (GGDEF)-like protein/PAS domain S-box-containing protein